MNKKAFIPISALIGALLLALVAAMTPFVAERNLAYAQAADSITVEYAENGTGPVPVALSATDPEMDTVTWSLSGGADQASFEIGTNDGVLRFQSPPDYENASGTNTTPNTYVVEVTATDSATPGLTDTFSVTVKVTNEDEPGKVTWQVDANGDNTLDTPTVAQFQIGAILTVPATGGVTDGDVSGGDKNVTERLQWYRSSSMSAMGTAIDGATGASYTVVAADIGMYIRVEAYYNVSTTAREESASLTSDYPVLAAKIGTEAPEFASSTVSREVNEGEKGMMVGAPVTATGGHGVLNYTLTGTGGDDAKFKIDQKTGQITTMFDLDREGTAEATAEAAGTCAGTPNTECTVTVTATDAAGAPSAPPATVTIKLKNVNDKPTFTNSGNESKSVPENTTEVTTDAGNDGYEATDPEESTVTLMLMGADSSLFRLTSADDLSFRTAPDYEMPSDANGDNIYEVTVRASDGVMYADRMVRVSVTNVNEGPEIMGNATVEYAENGTGPVPVALSATDPELDTVTWSLSGGADQASFEIGTNDGVLRFQSPPDYEGGPTSGGGDSDNDNTYEVIVTAIDTATTPNTDTFTVNVKITNVNEPGKVIWEITPASGVSATDLVQFQVGAVLNASVTDGDVQGTSKTPTNNLRWQWYRGNSAISGATGASYTVADVDIGSRLRVTAFYAVSATTREESASLTSDYPVLVAKTGTEAPEFASSTVSREVNEGEKGMMVGAPVTATGGHGVLNYTLTGDDLTKFKIDQKTGQITTMVDLDRETTVDAAPAFGCGTDYECTVTVTATDAAGAPSAPAATVTIKLNNVDDKPVFVTDGSGPPAATSPTGIMSPENRTALYGTDGPVTTMVGVTYGATDPDGDRINLSLMGADSGLFRLMGGGILSFRTAPNYEMPADANMDNMYEVTVRASDGTMYADKMVVVSVTGVNEAPMISSGGSIRGQSSITYEENDTDDVASYEASGFDGTVTWTLSGDDAGEFDISGGDLSFVSPPDYENPTDANTDNVYEVTVMANDGTDSAMLNVRITVTDVEDDMPTGGDLLERYDADDSGHIDLSEVNTAIDAYFNGQLTLAQVNTVIDLYFM